MLPAGAAHRGPSRAGRHRGETAEAESCEENKHAGIPRGWLHRGSQEGIRGWTAGMLGWREDSRGTTCCVVLKWEDA